MYLVYSTCTGMCYIVLYSTCIWSIVHVQVCVLYSTCTGMCYIVLYSTCSTCMWSIVHVVMYVYSTRTCIVLFLYSEIEDLYPLFVYAPATSDSSEFDQLSG